MDLLKAENEKFDKARETQDIIFCIKQHNNVIR